MERPSKFDEEIANTILARLRDGESLTRICSEQNMPSRQTFWRWTQGECSAPSSLADCYARARLDQADAFAEQVITIADSLDETIRTEAARIIDDLDRESSTYERDVREAHFLAKRRSTEAARLQIDSRKWVSGRMHPRSWGDRVSLEHSTPPDNPLKIDFTNMTDEQLRMAAKLAESLKREVSGGDSTPD